MKQYFMDPSNFFFPILVFSLATHIFITTLPKRVIVPSDFSVQEAPNTIDVLLIEEFLIQKMESNGVREEVVTIETLEDKVPEVVKKKKEDVVTIDTMEDDVPEVIEEKIVEKEDIKDPIEQEVIKEKIVEKEDIKDPIEQEVIKEKIVEKEDIKKDPIEKEVIKEEIVEKETVKEDIESNVSSIESHGAISKAKPLKHVNPAPLYPPKARRRGWEGEVLLKVFVKADGDPSNIEIEKSSGYKILDDMSTKTVYQWKFEPARDKFGNISSVIIVPIEFKLVMGWNI